MRYVVLFSVILISSLLGVLPAQAQNWQNNGQPMVAFSTVDLLENSDFSAGATGWKGTGTGLAWKTQDGAAVFQLKPLVGAAPSALSFSQAAPKTIQGGRTLCLRFLAQGNVPVSVALFDTLAPYKPILERRFDAPGNDNTEIFTLAVRAPRSFNTRELLLKFYLGYETGHLKLSNIKLLDQGATAPEELRLTPEIPVVPDVPAPVVPTIVDVPNDPTVARLFDDPAQNQDQAIQIQSLAGVKPFDLSERHLLENGDCSYGLDKWELFGKEKLSDYAVQNGFSKFHVNAEQGDVPLSAGLYKLITPQLHKGTRFTIRMRIQSDVKFSAMLQKIDEDYHKIWFQEIEPNTVAKYYVFHGVSDDDYPKQNIAFTFWVGGAAGDMKISDVDVLLDPPLGQIHREVWRNISGTDVSAIPVNSPPDDDGFLSRFETYTDWGDYFGMRVRGYLTAPSSGSYTFWIAGDDAAELWLSPDTNPAHKVRIAHTSIYTYAQEWNKAASQRSVPLHLVEGRRYYIEALQKEQGANDNMAVGWLKPGEGGNSPSEIIPGSVLSPAS